MTTIAELVVGVVLNNVEKGKTCTASELIQFIEKDKCPIDKLCSYGYPYVLFSQFCNTGLFERLEKGVYKRKGSAEDFYKYYDSNRFNNSCEETIPVAQNISTVDLLARINDLENKVNTMAAAFCAAGRNMETAFA